MDLWIDLDPKVDALRIEIHHSRMVEGLSQKEIGQMPSDQVPTCCHAAVAGGNPGKSAVARGHRGRSSLVNQLVQPLATIITHVDQTNVHLTFQKSNSDCSGQVFLMGCANLLPTTEQMNNLQIAMRNPRR